MKSILTFLWRRSYRNQSINLQIKSIDWFLYNGDFCHERINTLLLVCIHRCIFVDLRQDNRYKCHYDIDAEESNCLMLMLKNSCFLEQSWNFFCLVNSQSIIKNITLYSNPFSTNAPLLYPPPLPLRKHSRTSSFLMFLGSIEVKHWLKMG